MIGSFLKLLMHIRLMLIVSKSICFPGPGHNSISTQMAKQSNIKIRYIMQKRNRKNILEYILSIFAQKCLEYI